MSISQNFPDEGPSLVLNFAGSKTLDPRITFTRSSVGTYTNRNGLIVTAPADSPRFDHSVVGVGTTVTGVESLGLLIEEQRTNLLTYSEQFDNAAWAYTSYGTLATAQANMAVAPDGNTTADLITFAPDGTGQSRRSQFYVGLTTGTYTASVYVKKGTLSSISWLLTTNQVPYPGVTYDFDTDIVSGTGTFTRTIVGNGWVRLTSTYAITTHDAGIGFIGGSNGTVYAWGAQLEVGEFPTSYIPTEASTVTRNADNASITGTNFSSWYNQTGYTIFTRHVAPSVTQNGPYPRVFNITTTASGDLNRLNHYHAPLVVGSYRVGMSVVENNAIGHVDLITTFSQGLVAKMASRFAENNSALSVNGNIIGTDTNCSINSVTRDIITIGSAINGSYLNSTISQLIYYPYSISNNQLISLTR